MTRSPIRTVLCFFLVVLPSLPGAPRADAQEPPRGPQIDAGEIEPGSGSFTVEGGAHPGKRTRVFYHRPASFEREASVVMVVPGAGRNGDETLEVGFVVDTDLAQWTLDEVKEEVDSVLGGHGFYGHSGEGQLLYRLALLQRSGMLEEIEIRGTSEEPNRDPEEWIFDDFDRILREAREAAGALDAEFEWEKVIVPGVGHDYECMSEAAAEYLYGDESGDGS